MNRYVTPDDLDAINFVLDSNDSNVLIKRTPKGIKIIRETIRVIKNKEIEVETN